jgi:hypothetical protein
MGVLFNIFTKLRNGYIIERNEREEKQNENNSSRRHYPRVVFADRISVEAGTKGEAPAYIRICTIFSVRYRTSSRKDAHGAACHTIFPNETSYTTNANQW